MTEKKCFNTSDQGWLFHILAVEGFHSAVSAETGRRVCRSLVFVRSVSFSCLVTINNSQDALFANIIFSTNANQCLFVKLVLCIFSCYNSRLLVDYTWESFSELALWPSLPFWCHFVTLGQVNVTSSLQGAGGLVHWKCTNIISAVTLRDDFDFGIAVGVGAQGQRLTPRFAAWWYDLLRSRFEETRLDEISYKYREEKKKTVKKYSIKNT